MIGKNMSQMKIEKRKRKAYIKEIIGKHTVYTQDEVVQLLKDEFGVEVDQGTVSRDIREMNIKKDPKTKGYVLGERIIRNQEAKVLAEVFIDADVEMISSEMKSFLLKGKKEYLAVVAEQLEQFFSLDDINISIFMGYNGSMLVYYNQKDAKRVEAYLNQIKEYAAKRQARKKR